MLLIEDDARRVLLHRRPPTGVWAALWSLPEHADLAAARAWFDAHAHGDFDAAQAGDPIAHGFSHYRLHIHPHRIAGVRPRHAVGDNHDLRWATRADLAGIGLPAPVRRLLQASNEKE
jgi:A/G-specific adenine glycosylase